MLAQVMEALLEAMEPNSATHLVPLNMCPPFFLIFPLLLPHRPTWQSSGSSLALALLYPPGASGQGPHSNTGQ